MSGISSSPQPIDNIPSFTRQGIKYELEPTIEKNGVKVPWSKLTKAEQNAVAIIARDLSAPNIANALRGFKKVELISEGNKSNLKTIVIQTRQATTLIFKPDPLYDPMVEVGTTIKDKLTNLVEKAHTILQKVTTAINADQHSNEISDATMQIIEKGINDLQTIPEEMSMWLEAWEKQKPQEANSRVRQIDNEIKTLLAQNSIYSPNSLQQTIDEFAKYAGITFPKQNSPQEVLAKSKAMPKPPNSHTGTYIPNDRNVIRSMDVAKSIETRTEMLALLKENFKTAKDILSFLKIPNTSKLLSKLQPDVEFLKRLDLITLENAYNNLAALTKQWEAYKPLSKDVKGMKKFDIQIRELIYDNESLSKMKSAIEFYKKQFSDLPKDAYQDVTRNYKFLSVSQQMLLKKIPPKLWTELEKWKNSMDKFSGTPDEIPKTLLNSFLKAIHSDNPITFEENRTSLSYILRQVLAADTRERLNEPNEKGTMEQVD